MSEEDKEKTALVTPMGFYEFNRMPFELCNALATFQRVMEHCLGYRNFKIVLLYLDNIIIFSRTYSDHLQHLWEVFKWLAEYGLKLKPGKCHKCQVSAYDAVLGPHREFGRGLPLSREDSSSDRVVDPTDGDLCSAVPRVRGILPAVYT